MHPGDPLLCVSLDHPAAELSSAVCDRNPQPGREVALHDVSRHWVLLFRRTDKTAMNLRAITPGRIGTTPYVGIRGYLSWAGQPESSRPRDRFAATADVELAQDPRSQHSSSRSIRSDASASNASSDSRYESRSTKRGGVAVAPAPGTGRLTAPSSTRTIRPSSHRSACDPVGHPPKTGTARSQHRWSSPCTFVRVLIRWRYGIRSASYEISQ
jgi:hypothetical protein